MSSGGNHGTLSNAPTCNTDGYFDFDSDLVCCNLDSCALDEEDDIESGCVCGNVGSCALDAEN